LLSLVRLSRQPSCRFSPAYADACFSIFANKTTVTGLGSDNVGGVYADGNNVYAATTGGLSISIDAGRSFANKTTANGLGDDDVYGVYADGSNVYAATPSGLVITAVCVSTTSSSSSDPDVLGIFLTVNSALVGKQVEGSPVYYGADRVAVTSTYVLTVTAVSNISPSLVTLAEGTIGVNEEGTEFHGRVSGGLGSAL
jgi:hypothetical protein